jgi:hypothetical protein
MIREYFYLFRYWLASKIVGFNIENEVEAAHAAGVEWGKIHRINNVLND